MKEASCSSTAPNTGQSVVKPEAVLLIILTLVRESDIKEVRGNIVLLFKNKFRGQKYPGDVDKCTSNISYLTHWPLGNLNDIFYM